MHAFRPLSRGLTATLLLCLVAAMVGPAAGQDTESQDDGGAAPAFGGPDAVENQLRDDAETKEAFFDRQVPTGYFEWKERLQEERGLSLGWDYSAVYLSASESLGEDDAGSGMVRFYGSWDLAGRGSRDTGAFVWKVEHRHRYSDIPVSDLGFEIGYVGLFEPPFNSNDLRLTNLYWRQRMDDGRVTLVGGFLDATDYVDVFALGSPWTHFNNFAFSTGTTTIALPNDATFGVAAGAMLTDNLFIIGGLTDTNSDPTDPFEGFDTFFNDNEYFKSVEVGWTTSQDRIYFDNMHLTLWHADERGEAGTPDGWGAVFSYTHYVGERWMPFIRGGFSDDGGALMEESVSVGMAYQWVPGRDVLGVGLNWGNPNEESFGPDLDSQTTFEAFYRLQLSQQLAVTPSIQLIADPALNTEESTLWVLGLRARMAF